MSFIVWSKILSGFSIHLLNSFSLRLYCILFCVAFCLRLNSHLFSCFLTQAFQKSFDNSNRKSIVAFYITTIEQPVVLCFVFWFTTEPSVIFVHIRDIRLNSTIPRIKYLILRIILLPEFIWIIWFKYLLFFLQLYCVLT